MKILLSAIIIFCGFLTNPLFAKTWTPTGAPTNGWSQIFSSADGSKLAAIVTQPSVVWISTNAGMTWTSNNVPGVPDSGRVTSAAWSANGDKLAAVALFASAVFTSTNYGATWTSNNVQVEPWWRIASSADGTKLVALGGGLSSTAPIYISADSGLTWMPAHAPVTNWAAVVAAANGSNWVAAVETQSPPGGSIYTSTNCGLDWILMTGAPNLQYLSLASSADGTKIITAATGNGVGAIYTSTNFGVSWTSNNLPNEGWSNVASSADGNTLAATAFIDLFGNFGLIYTSTNSGTTWISNSVPSQNWTGIASSADGGILVAAGGKSFGLAPGAIYISQAVPAPKLNLVSVSNTLALTWLIPSTNFVLQQNLALTTTNWGTLTNSSTFNFNNLNNELFLSPSNSRGFFRLITQ